MNDYNSKITIEKSENGSINCNITVKSEKNGVKVSAWVPYFVVVVITIIVTVMVTILFECHIKHLLKSLAILLRDTSSLYLTLCLLILVSGFTTALFLFCNLRELYFESIWKEANVNCEILKKAIDLYKEPVSPKNKGTTSTINFNITRKNGDDGQKNGATMKTTVNDCNNLNNDSILSSCNI